MAVLPRRGCESVIKVPPSRPGVLAPRRIAITINQDTPRDIFQWKKSIVLARSSNGESGSDDSFITTRLLFFFFYPPGPA